ncbi:MAG: preprotein translocase subunit YajC [Verrucomicrobiales bacterium]
MGPAPTPGADPRANMLQALGPLVIMGIIFYVILIRPQQKKARQHAELLKAVKPGDKIVTTGGILGVVVTVKDKSVSIRSADTKLEILKSSIGEILEKSSGTSSATES